MHRTTFVCKNTHLPPSLIIQSMRARVAYAWRSLYPDIVNGPIQKNRRWDFKKILKEIVLFVWRFHCHSEPEPIFGAMKRRAFGCINQAAATGIKVNIISDWVQVDCMNLSIVRTDKLSRKTPITGPRVKETCLLWSCTTFDKNIAKKMRLIWINWVLNHPNVKEVTTYLIPTFEKRGLYSCGQITLDPSDFERKKDFGSSRKQPKSIRKSP